MPFLKNWKKVPWFWEKVRSLWSSIGQISHLKYIFPVFPGKKTEIFPCRDRLSCAVDECLSKCPNSKKTPCRDKLLVKFAKFFRTTFNRTPPVAASSQSTLKCRTYYPTVWLNLQFIILSQEMCFILSVQSYIQGALRKRQLISYFVEHLALKN